MHIRTLKIFVTNGFIEYYILLNINKNAMWKVKYLFLMDGRIFCSNEVESDVRTDQLALINC